MLVLLGLSDSGTVPDGSAVRSDSPAPPAPSSSQEETEKPPDPELEKRLLGYLSDLSLSLPIDSLAISNELNNVRWFSGIIEEPVGCGVLHYDFFVYLSEA